MPPVLAMLALNLLGLQVAARGAAAHAGSGAAPLPPTGRPPPPGQRLPASWGTVGVPVPRPDGQPYSIGSITVDHLWVDPMRGADINSGGSAAQALRTITAAWARVPTRTALARGFHIHLLPGEFTEGMGEGYERAGDMWCSADS